MKYVYLLIIVMFSSLLSTVDFISINADNKVPTNQESSVNINEVDAFTNVAIFIRFSDETTYEAPRTFAYYLNMFNGLDQVSLRDYYLEVSYDKLDITTYLVNDNLQIIYYNDFHERSYYEEYDEISNPVGYIDGQQDDREHQLLKRAINFVEDNNLIPEDIVLDANDDGDIDSITFMVSGEDNGWNTLLWPHKWSLHSFYNDGEYDVDAPVINGKYAYSYTFELLGNSTAYYNEVDVAVLAHETFHLISAPDLYHYYRYDWIEPVGSWGLMEQTGETPSHMLGYMKQYYGNWISEVEEISTSGSYTLYPLQDDENNLYRIDTGYSNEYIYLEYRDDEGIYESNLPDKGLLVYRVDFDYYDYGNVEGYYTEDGEPTNEVFIFRPGIHDEDYPIIFSFEDLSGIDDDGLIDYAALSQRNLIGEIGKGTDTVMFHSDGSEMDISIFNVFEHDGYITFDVSLSLSINLVSDFNVNPTSELRLVDIEGLEYYATIDNVGTESTVYYTTDGSTPSNASSLYENNPIQITSSNNTLKAAIYNGDNLINQIEKTFQFDNDIRSNHQPYGNELDITWFINTATTEEISLYFDEHFELELDYDYLYIQNGDTITNYTGTDLSDVKLDFTTNSLLINFVTDQYVDDYYGFDADLSLGIDVASLELVGNKEITLAVHTDYIDQGVSVINDPLSEYTLQIVNPVDANVIGTYIIEYRLLNSAGEIINATTRTIIIVDDTAPLVTLIGEENIVLEVYTNYTELGITITDNYDTITDYEMDGEVLTEELGTYLITYFVVDSSGNLSDILTRTIEVVDTTAPEVTLKPGVDTIYIGDDWMNYGVDSSDNYSDSVDVIFTGEVDSGIAGTYEIIYQISDSSDNISEVTRIVTVLAPEIEGITCDGANYFQYIEDIEIPNCMIDQITIDNFDLMETNIITSRITEIIWMIEYNGVSYYHKQYMVNFRLDDNDIAYIDPKRSDYL